MKDSLLLRIVLSLSLLIGLSAQANEGWYQVEVLVFKQQSGDISQPEQFPKVSSQPRAGIELAQSGRVWNGDPQSNLTSFARLPSSAYILNRALSQFNRMQRYQTLFHASWYEYLTPGQAAQPVSVNAQQGSMHLQGSIGVQLQRFLHTQADMELRIGETYYPLKASAQMRSEELHYLDHPEFGVLIQINPILRNR